MARSAEHVTLDLKLVSSNPMLGLELTYKTIAAAKPTHLVPRGESY